MAVILSDAVFIVGALFCTIGTVPSRSLGLIYTGRLLTGLGVGGIAAVSPIYIAEISPPAIRGRLTGFFESFYQTGAVIGFWINYGIVHNLNTNDSNAWRIPMSVQLIPAGILACMIPLLKESPTWLLKRGREEEAYKVYSFIRMLPADHEYIAQDVQFVRDEIAKERAALVGSANASLGQIIRGAAREASLKGMRNRFLLVFLMFMWQAWSGAAAINCKCTPDTLIVPRQLIAYLERLLTHYLYLHRSYRRHSLDRHIRRYQSWRIHHLLHLVHRQVRKKMAMDCVFPCLRFLPVLSCSVHCASAPEVWCIAIGVDRGRWKGRYSNDHDIWSILEYWREWPPMDHLS